MNQANIEEETRKRRVKAENLAKAALEGTGNPTEEQIQAEYGAIVAKYKTRLSFSLARRQLRKQGLAREPTADEASVEAAGLPDVADLVIGKRQFGGARCGCTFHRRGGECDCSLCTYMSHNTMRLRRDMVNWHTGANKKCDLGCMDAGGSCFREALVDLHQLTKYLLCDRVVVPELTRAGAKARFWTYQQSCLHSTCSAPILNRKCGWSDKAPSCPLFTSSARYGWKRYENIFRASTRRLGSRSIAPNSCCISGPSPSSSRNSRGSTSRGCRTTTTTE